jgi:hypothetical protein
MEFDFRRHQLTLETTQGEHRAVPLEPKTVAQFHAETTGALRELPLALTAPRVIPQGLYERAVDILGDRGVTDLTLLRGYFCTVCFTLNAYNVPAGAADLKRGDRHGRIRKHPGRAAAAAGPLAVLHRATRAL